MLLFIDEVNATTMLARSDTLYFRLHHENTLCYTCMEMTILASKRNASHLSILLGVALLFPLKALSVEPAVEPIQAESMQPEPTLPDPAQLEQPAQPEPVGPETIKLEPVEPDIYIYPIDAPREYLSEKFVSLVSSIDYFFGDDRNYQESNNSVFQINMTRLLGGDGEQKFVLSGRAKVHLPNTKKRLNFLLEADPEQNISSEAPPGQALLNKQVTTPSSYAAALRYEVTDKNHWHFSADAGIKFRGLTNSPNPFARSRGSYSVTQGQWRLKIAESLFWFNSIGAGESTQFDAEHFVSDTALFRATSNATWLNEKKNFDLRQDFSIYHTVSDRTALLYQASAIGVSQPQLQTTEYIVLVLYRYRLHRNWIFFELSPQLHFPRATNFDVTPLLNLRLEMLFDGSK